MSTAPHELLTFTDDEIRDLLRDQLGRHDRIGSATIGPRGRATQAVMACGVLRVAILFDEACDRKRQHPIPRGFVSGGPRI